MGRGRKRKYQPTIPDHIDQSKLPAGIYWDKSGSGRWFVYEPDQETGKRVGKTIAGRKALLSELHSIMEARTSDQVVGSIGYVFTYFEKSTEWRKLAAKTKRDYRYCMRVAKAYVTQFGPTLDKLIVDRCSLPVMQAINEAIASGREPSRPGARDGVDPMPSKANHLIRFLRRLFDWGMRLGKCTKNPAEGVKLADELGEYFMPEPAVYDAVLKFARQRGALKPHTKGSLPPYLAPIMEHAYLCRMRGIEAVTLTEAHVSDEGITVSRRKGSNDSIVRWNPRLRGAYTEAITIRATILSRTPARGRPIPIRPDKRFLFLTESGTPLTKDGLDSAWQDLMAAALESNVITPEDRFSLHGVKHYGITDTKGSKRKKKLASGHKTDAALDIYDHEVPIVDPAGE